MDIPTPKKKTAKPQKYLWPVFGGGTLLILFIFLPDMLGNALPSVKHEDIWVSEVVAGDFIRQVRGVGTFVSVSDRWVTVESSGLVERVLVKPGSAVQPETVLVELSNPQLERELLQIKSDLMVAEVELEAFSAKLMEDFLQGEYELVQAKLNYESSKSVEDAMAKLAKGHVISQLEFIKAQQELRINETLLKMLQKRQPYIKKSHEAQLASKEASIKQLRFQLQNAQEQVDRLNIKAGISGVLQQLTLEEGELAGLGTKIARVAKPDLLMAELMVQEVLAKDITAGLLVEIDARNGKVEGAVTRVDPRVENGNVKVDVELTGTLPQGARPSQSVTGTITVEKVAKTFYIERPGFAVPGTKVPLFVLNESGDKAERKEILLGRASINYIEIVSGLSPGDKVIISDQEEFKKHNSIKIN